MGLRLPKLDVACPALVAAWAAVIACAGALGQVASARPQSAADAPSEAPEAAAAARPRPTSPGSAAAAERLRWAVGYLNGDFDSFKDAKFSAALLGEISGDELERVMREFAGASGGVRVLETVPGEGPRATAWVRTVSRGEDWTLTIEVEGAAPHAIERLVLAPAPARKDPEYPGWGVFDADMRQLSEGEGRSASFACFESAASGELVPVHGFEPSRRVSIGTMAMLFVAGAAAEAVSTGAMRWDQPLAIAPECKSVPDSAFGQGVTGAEHPISAYVRAMLADADNTAADHLIAILGRERIERERDRWAGDDAGEPDPFMSTLEFYKIKCAPTADVLRHYAVEEPAGRRRLLEDEVARSRVVFALMQAWTQPQYVGTIGWFSSAEALARELARLRGLGRGPGMEALNEALKPASIPAGLLLDGREWTGGWLVSGGEPGVFGAAWMLERADGRVFVLALVINDQNHPVDPLEVQPVITATGRLLARTGAAPAPSTP